MQPQGHSPLGASGASRFIACPGSVLLSQGIQDDDEDDTFSLPGTAAHAVGQECLQQKTDAWTHIGRVYDKKVGNLLDKPKKITAKDRLIWVDKGIADAVQVYLNAIRSAHPEMNQGNSWVERKFFCPQLHKYFYGTADFTYYDAGARELHVWDYKHGAGVVVEVENNVQTMYYAAGAITDLDLWTKVDTVHLHIVQPRGFHWNGPVRTWSLTVEALDNWLTDTLLPAMDRALVSRDTDSGEHCRFCPVRFRLCPQHVKDFAEIEGLIEMIGLDGKGAAALTGEQIARYKQLVEVAKIVGTAVDKTAYVRLEKNANAVPGYKLAPKKADRIWKDGAEKELVKKFGEDAFTERKLRSPAQIEALPEGGKYTARYAFKPNTGNTVVKIGDARVAVKKDVSTKFKPVKG